MAMEAISKCVAFPHQQGKQHCVDRNLGEVILDYLVFGVYLWSLCIIMDRDIDYLIIIYIKPLFANNLVSTQNVHLNRLAKTLKPLAL